MTVCGTRLITVSALYTNVESPRYMPDANVIVYVNYNLKINLGKKRQRPLQKGRWDKEVTGRREVEFTGRR